MAATIISHLVHNGPSSRPARKVTIALGETVLDFMARNRIGGGRAGEPTDVVVDLDTIKDTAPVVIEKRLILAYADGAQSFDLPSGRALNISQTAGVIEDFAMTIFDAPRSFAEATAFLHGFIDELETKGWSLRHAPAVPVSADALSRSEGWTIVGHLEDPAGHDLEIKIVDYGRAPKQPSWIVLPLGRSDQPSHTYLVQVSVAAPGPGVRYGETIEPRRLFATGSRFKALPLRAWVDDPGWTPAKAGMVPTPPDTLRAHPDAGQWMMPR